MKIIITKWEPFSGNSKTFKGRFSFKFSLNELGTDNKSTREVTGEVNGCSLFDNGKNKWIVYPDKKIKSEATGNWEHAYTIFQFLEPKEAISAELLKYLNDYTTQNAPGLQEECPF
jgi:hypothetical protein